MSQARAAVTVIIPAWGVSEYVGETLASLQAQTRGDWEAVVIDDGDTQKVAAALAPFASDPRIRLLATDNVGLAGARNRGIATATTPYISMVDGDDRYRHDYLELMVAALESDEKLGFVTTDALMFGNPAFEGRLFSSTQPQSGAITLERVIRREFNVCGGSIVRREVMEAVGGYDARLRSAEDLDLWIRILERGWGAGKVDAPLLQYRRRAGSLSATSLSMARWEQQVFAQAVERLEGRPEQAAARDMLASAENRLRMEQGLAAVAEGRTREGLRLLRRTDIAASSAKWRLAMAAFRLFPPLAGPVIRFYMRDQPFSGTKQAEPN
jgi:cellulose synthase/poly-beta-1,6-N-acetylglucosamine synthase-like glycosyltransferase